MGHWFETIDKGMT
uniref:Uncharacterized protein n=1 Tax=Anguilla anguilla TaxID=7936 RepID=A0A0E9T978_ANGAN